MTQEYWTILKLPCTDGQQRVGMDEDVNQYDEQHVLKNKLTFEQADNSIKEIAEKNQLEIFDDLNGSYDVDWSKVKGRSQL